MKIIPKTEFYKIILQRPGMWVGENSLSKFQCLITGIQTAEQYHKIPDEEKLFPKFPEFEQWIFKKLRRKLNGKSFALAQLKSKNDDKKALILWASWYQEFLEKKN
jgi:hypothetical protein